MLVHLLRRWPNIDTPSGQNVVFDGSPKSRCNVGSFHDGPTLNQFGAASCFFWDSLKAKCNISVADPDGEGRGGGA